MKEIVKIPLLAFLLSFLVIADGDALEKPTHEALNERATNASIVNSYMINQLGFSEGLKTTFNNKWAIDWIKIGGIKEDEPFYTRSFNHFHNPLLSWDQAGYGGIFKSAILWAQDQGTSGSLFGGNYSWRAVRDYYYLGLTSSTKTDREKNLAETFRGLGQLMHLVTDMSVPAHSRNDGHLFYNYEKWVLGNPVDFVNATAFPAFFSNAIQDISSLFDTDHYNGINPSAGLNLGLAEYSNANFFSENTIFDEQNFPYPKKSSTNLQSYIDSNELPEIITAEDNIPDTAFYIKKDKDGEIIKRFVKPGYFTNPILTTDPTSPVLSLSFILDENVYKDYASLLLPRAVGYSAGLLNYFFRGNMDFTIDANDREDGTKGVKISNRSNEDMDGTFSLYYDTADTNRHLLGSWNISLTSQGTSQVLSFPLPQDYNKYKYTLAFRGRMGAEQDAVAGYQYTGWREEWNNGLKGNHTWLHTDIDLILQNFPYYGHTTNEIADGKLIKENISYPGNDLPRVNQTIILDAYKKVASNTNPYCVIRYSDFCFPYDFGEEFPLSINKNTWIGVKIDEMSINETIPYQNCSPDNYGHGEWQGIIITFDNGIDISFTVQGEVPPENIVDWVSYIELGKETTFNIFDAFKAVGLEFIEPVNITGIDIVQQLWYLCNPATVEYRQRMVVDYIRIEER